jgi:hypothetical protein
MSANQNDVHPNKPHPRGEKINVDCPHCLHTPCDFNCVQEINVTAPNAPYSAHQQALRLGKAHAMWQQEKKNKRAAHARSCRRALWEERTGFHTDGRKLIAGTDQWFFPPAPQPSGPCASISPVVDNEDQSDSEEEEWIADYAEETESDYSSSGGSSDESDSCKRKINRAEVDDVRAFAKKNGRGTHRGRRDSLEDLCQVCNSDRDRHCGEIIHYSGCPNVKVEHHGWDNEVCYCGTLDCDKVVYGCWRKAVIKFQTEHYGECTYFFE